MQNGGVIADDCSKCMCPQGYSGLDCGSGVSVTPLAGCAGAAAEVKATWAFGAGTLLALLVQKSLLYQYKVALLLRSLLFASSKAPMYKSIRTAVVKF
jgi:hypothetical protein